MDAIPEDIGTERDVDALCIQRRLNTHNTAMAQYIKEIDYGMEVFDTRHAEWACDKLHDVTVEYRNDLFRLNELT